MKHRASGRAWWAADRLAAGLAFLGGLIALGLWLIVLPLFAMGSVDAGALYTALLVLAFFGWPAAALLAVTAARTVTRQPRRAAVLLLPVAVSLIFPFYLPALVPLAAAALAFPRQPSGARDA